MFKDYIADDIKKTFFNLEEFAEEVDINGATVSVMEDSEKLESRIKKDYDGLIIGDVLFYISMEEYKKIPFVKGIPTANQAIRYDGKPCTITNVNTENGVYEIILTVAGG